MDQKTVPVYIGDGISQKGQVLHRDDIGLEGMEVSHPPGGMVKAIQAFPELLKQFFCTGSKSLHNDMDMGIHNLEGDDPDVREQMADQSEQVHGETKVVFCLKQDQTVLPRSAYVEKGPPATEKVFTLPLTLSERKRSGWYLTVVFHGDKTRECDPFCLPINRLIIRDCPVD